MGGGGRTPVNLEHTAHVNGETPAARDYMELVRAPAILTVLGDTIAGGAASGQATTPRRVLLPFASACLYAGGMALNDWADLDIDARERPERPIPSGRISSRQALGVATALTGAGLALAAVAGGPRALAVAVPLAASVWTYDTIAKDHPTGPFVMAACRGLDVLMGAGVGRLRAAAPTAMGIASHTAAVTLVSRGEVHGTSAATAAVAGSVTTAGAVGIVTGLGRGSKVQAAATAVGTIAYLATCLPAQVAAAREPSGPRARAATRQGIRAMVPLQAAWAARAGSVGGAAVLAGVDLAGRWLRQRAQRAVSET